ncbi:DEAD/DEAH box helicase [Carboxylicivirga caseinilyticus]|uniref:DEAD/DEAH box helicase n=1 Tax=Carboxylicivirga caseinilyticus TaxID=3417572 RepID=UPI003D337487|nr:DEAD/DEAH box helicase [Marinilabiliaceae bacterium A049]
MQTFKESGLPEEVLKAIGELGYETPTPIQTKTIPEILNYGNDLIALAQTGTGKTGAFGLPVIPQIITEDKKVQALILCPTRELCLQITKDLNNYAKYYKDLYITPVYGGTEIRTQIRALKRGTHIVVGTPGRMNDLINRNAIELGDVRWLILDEADEMLNMGFKDDLESIMAQTPEWRQTLLFSATMPPDIARMSKQYMQDPVEISVGTKNSGSSNVEHHYYMVHASDRYKALKRIVDVTPDVYGIVFCRTRQETKDIADSLMADGYNADAIHGDLSQAQRDLVMHRFRKNHLQLLVATDVAARGIDVNDLTHVINYNLPDDIEVYIHRSGRTGRAGKKGISVSIIHAREAHRIKAIEKIAKKTFERKWVPKADEICEKQLFHFLDRVDNTVLEDDSPVKALMPAVYEKLATMEREQLITQFVAAEFNRFMEYYKDAPDLNIYKEDRSKGRNGGGRRGDVPFSRLFINLGKTDKVSSGDIIGLINSKFKGTTVKVGKIELLRNFSFIEVDKDYEQEVIEKLGKTKLKGKKVSLEVATPKPSSKRRTKRRQ